MSTSQLPPLRAKPENLTQLVLEAIKDAIVEKRFAPGSRLSEATLAAQLEVSKTPVREALLRLRHIGLVEATRRGMRVVRPSAQMIRNAYELRAGLERTAACHAAARSSESAQADIRRFAEESLACAEAGDYSGFREADRKFHRLVAECSHNPLLASAIDELLLLTSALRLRDVPDAGHPVRCASQHVRVAEAIRVGDAESAAQEMAQHLEHVMSAVLAAIGGPAASTG